MENKNFTSFELSKVLNLGGYRPKYLKVGQLYWNENELFIVQDIFNNLPLLTPLFSGSKGRVYELKELEEHFFFCPLLHDYCKEQNCNIYAILLHEKLRRRNKK